MITFLAAAALGLIVAGTLTRLRNARAARRGLERARRLGVAPGPAAEEGGARALIPVLMPVCGRPHYLRQGLTALSRAEGIRDALLVVSQDGDDPEVSRLLEGIGFTRVVLLKHERPFLGVFAYFWDGLHAVSSNIRFLLDFAFDGLGAEHAIVLEDDIVPSPDFHRWFSWACRHVLADERVLSVTGFNLHSRASAELGFDPREHPHDLVENREEGRAKFTGWSWAIRAGTWRRVREDWSSLSWDTRLDEVQRRRGLISYKPVLARVKNIGMQGGINFTEAEGNPKWAGLVLAEAAYAYDDPPGILPDDPARPAFTDAAPSEPVRNERTRTRARRLWLLGLVVAMTLAALLAWGALRR
ncbi:MAG: hypothetical protein FIA95_05615 [Gemmatimonadetes bacterium]|nr:hypothetical protein [Gemmatimonadota bacterium]